MVAAGVMACMPTVSAETVARALVAGWRGNDCRAHPQREGPHQTAARQCRTREADGGLTVGGAKVKVDLRPIEPHRI